jgi:hypothetical protein
MMIVNEDSRAITKLETSLSDDARVVFYNRHMFIVLATGFTCKILQLNVRFLVRLGASLRVEQLKG